MELIDSELKERIAQLDIPFNTYGYDHLGVSKEHLEYFFTFLSFLYNDYFRVRTFGLEHVPSEGRVMIVGNHSGGIPIDGGMILASLMLDAEKPRLVQGMVEKFANRMPFLSTWFSRVGQFTGLPEHAVRILENERALMVFPEGARGTAKLHKDQFTLVRFGTGFMRLALQTGTPIVPAGFLGGGDAFPTVLNLKRIGKLFGLPYLPITRHILPLPLPKPCELYYGEPMVFEGTGNEEDEVIERYVQEVKDKIGELITRGLRRREQEQLALQSPS
jgi:1-acyl-sn-glycerol-3-phosphate acyltransferase